MFTETNLLAERHEFFLLLNDMNSRFRQARSSESKKIVLPEEENNRFRQVGRGKHEQNKEKPTPPKKTFKIVLTRKNIYHNVVGAYRKKQIYERR